MKKKRVTRKSKCVVKHKDFAAEWAEPLILELEDLAKQLREKKRKRLSFRYIDPQRLEVVLEKGLEELRPSWFVLPVDVGTKILRWLTPKEAWRIGTSLSRAYRKWTKENVCTGEFYITETHWKEKSSGKTKRKTNQIFRKKQATFRMSGKVEQIYCYDLKDTYIQLDVDTTCTFYSHQPVFVYGWVNEGRFPRGSARLKAADHVELSSEQDEKGCIEAVKITIYAKE